MSKVIAGIGEMMVRLSPSEGTLMKMASSFQSYYGGSEANVLITASSLNKSCRYLTCFPNNALGEGAIRFLKQNEIDTSFIQRSNERMGLYFVEEGNGYRPSQVVYDRKDSSIHSLDASLLPLDAFFKDVCIFFLTGITLALSATCRKTALFLVKEAKKRKIQVAFDFNYRQKLWSVEEARQAYKEILPYVDICFGNEYDLKTFLSCQEPVIPSFFHLYPATFLIHTKRDILSASKNALQGFGYARNGNKIDSVVTERIEFDILDRIGAGDAFDGGVLSKLLESKTLKEALDTGLACDVLKHSIKGDSFPLTQEDVNAFLAHQRMDVKR